MSLTSKNRPRGCHACWAFSAEESLKCLNDKQTNEKTDCSNSQNPKSKFLPGICHLHATRLLRVNGGRRGSRPERGDPVRKPEAGGEPAKRRRARRRSRGPAEGQRGAGGKGGPFCAAACEPLEEGSGRSVRMRGW